jgi:His-Xaa-Ser system radical SAM maturase HxsB
MTVWPLRFRDLTDDTLVFGNEAGGWFKSDHKFLARYAEDRLTLADQEFLALHGHSYESAGDLAFNAFAYRWVGRQNAVRPLSYVLLIPTLRCNISCTYCQVSRAAPEAKGYDWTPETLRDVRTFLDRIECDEVKVEFQGGEPLLRIDLLEEVREFARKRFTKSEFVVCTNLQRLGEREWAFFDSEDTHISTSIDGPPEAHDKQRTQDRALLTEFLTNLETAHRRVGAARLSALPTIDPFDPPDLSGLIETYLRYGLTSIYLRPINHHGFARRLGQRPNEIERWNALHSEFVELLIERNAAADTVVQEYYFTQCLNRVLRSGVNNHVDIRNPNILAADSIVIDYDGALYPTDESRMLSRIGHIDLSIGSVKTGVNRGKVNELNQSCANNFDPDCVHCPYQPFCGTDIIDDISRYGRIDIPRHTTWFCKRHLAVFDKVFDLIYRNDAKTKRSLAAWAGIPEWTDGIGVRHS